MILISPFVELGPHCQPYARLRAKLFQGFLSNYKFVEALLRQLVVFIYIDPIYFPQISQPVRLLHKYVLYKLTIHLANSLIHRKENKYDEVLTLPANIPGIEFRIITVGILREIISGVGKKFGKDSQFATVMRVEMIMGFFLTVVTEKRGVKDRMVGEMLKYVKALIEPAHGSMISIK